MLREQLELNTIIFRLRLIELYVEAPCHLGTGLESPLSYLEIGVDVLTILQVVPYRLTIMLNQLVSLSTRRHSQ